MRATIHQLLIAQSTLTTFVPAARWFQVGSVVDVPPKPFVIERWIAPVPGNAKGSFAKQLRIDIHDERGSYALIDDFLRALEPVLKGVQALTGPDGTVVQCDFLGIGGDQADDVYNSSFSFSSWQVIGVST